MGMVSTTKSIGPVRLMYFVRIGLLFFLYVRNIAFQISHIYSENKKNPNDP